MNDDDDIVPITKAGLRAFMYESYNKGEVDMQERIKDKIKNSRRQISGLSGIGNAVLVEELLIDLIDSEAR